MKKNIATILLGVMLLAIPMTSTAQTENPTSQQMEAISQALNADLAIKTEIQKVKTDLENPQAIGQELDPEAERAAHLASMEHWSMQKKLMFGVKLLILGMIVVGGVLILIALVTGFLNNQEIKKEEEIEQKVQAALKSRLAAMPAAAAPAAPVATAGGIDGATVAAIAGAVTAVLRGRRFRIKSLKLASNVGSAWSQHGRQTIMASHSLERKSR